jgi:hypothetical protein
LVNDFGSSGRRSIEIELIGLTVIGDMMVDIEGWSANRLFYPANAVKAHIHRYQKVCGDVLPFFHFPYKLISRQHRKCCRDIIIDENLHLFAQSLECMHKTKGTADGIAIGVHMGSKHNAFMGFEFRCRFRQ